MTLSPALQAGITRDIYGMPAFVTLVVADPVAASTWFTTALDFVELFAMPGPDGPDAPALIHLRRWRYQDVLVRRGAPTAVGDGIQLSLAAEADELPVLAARARDAGADVEGPIDTPWNTTDLRVTSPQGLLVVFTARRPAGTRDEAFSADMTRWSREQLG